MTVGNFKDWRELAMSVGRSGYGLDKENIVLERTARNRRPG
jgi:hypothetical protein